VSRKRVGLALDLVECEGDAELRSRVHQALVGAVAARAEFLRDVIGARYALPRNVRVQLERVIDDLRRRRLRQALPVQLKRGFQASLADKAPGTDHVGDDVDAERHGDFPRTACSMIPQP